MQKEHALALVRSAGVEVPEEGCGVPEIQKFQECYAEKGLVIVVYTADENGDIEKPFFNGRAYLESKNKEILGQLNILYGHNHYTTITSITGAVYVKNFCNVCNKGFNKTHICPAKCPCCHKNPPCLPTTKKFEKCEACRLFFSQEML